MDAFEIISFAQEITEKDSNHLGSFEISKIYAVVDRCCAGLLSLKEAKEDIKKIANVSWLIYHSI